MPKPLYSVNNSQGQLLYMGIAQFGANEALTQIVDDLLTMRVIFLNENNADGRLRCSKVHNEVVAIVQRTK